MDPLTAAVVNILGRYAIDAGATLLKEAGQAAANAAVQLFQYVMDRLKADPAEARNAERFELNPRGYQTPIAEAIAEKVKSDPDFAARLETLFGEFEKFAGPVDRSSANIGSAGSGAVAVQGSVAAGAGGVAVAGNVSGEITVNKTPP